MIDNKNFINYYEKPNLVSLISFSIFQLLTLLLIVVLIGILANIAGFGGAIIIIPFLTVFYGFPLKIIIGSTLTAIALPALIGFIAAYRRNEVDLTAGVILEIPTILGAIIGALTIDYLNDQIVILIFGIIALLVSVLMIRRTLTYNEVTSEELQSPIWDKLTQIPPFYRIEKETYTYRLSIPLMIFAGLSIGFLSGLLGVGGGWLKTPLLIFGIGLPPIIASGTALFMLVLTAISGGYVHYISGNWDFNLFIIISIALSVGAILGDKIKQRINNFYISIIISIALAFVAVIMLINNLIV